MIENVKVSLTVSLGIPIDITLFITLLIRCFLDVGKMLSRCDTPLTNFNGLVSFEFKKDFLYLLYHNKGTGYPIG